LLDVATFGLEIVIANPNHITLNDAATEGDSFIREQRCRFQTTGKVTYSIHQFLSRFGRELLLGKDAVSLRVGSGGRPLRVEVFVNVIVPPGGPIRDKNCRTES
jgi:hypothetical protein